MIPSKEFSSFETDMIVLDSYGDDPEVIRTSLSKIVNTYFDKLNNEEKIIAFGWILAWIHRLKYRGDVLQNIMRRVSNFDEQKIQTAVREMLAQLADMESPEPKNAVLGHLKEELELREYHEMTEAVANMISDIPETSNANKVRTTVPDNERVVEQQTPDSAQAVTHQPQISRAVKSNGSHGAKSSFPVDFSMYDENMHYVLYITDDPSKDQKLKVELKNTSGQEIDLSPLQEMAGKSNFEFRFRKGVLSDRTLGILRKSTPELSKLSILSDADQVIWDVSLNETIADDKHAVSLSFRNIQSVPIPLSPDSSLTLNLQNISAEAGSGARGTRVEFIPHLMKFNDDKQTLVTGNREQHLFVTNHSGQKQIPLHVGFVGSNKILNDGQSQSTLRLRIQNIAKPGQKHFETTAITFKAQTSQFIISFDVQKGNESKPWAMCRADELKITAEPEKADTAATIRTGLKLKVGNSEKPLKKPEDAAANTNAEIQIDDPTVGQGQSPELKMTFQQDVILNQGDYIEVELSGFQSSLPLGFAHMYLNYNNIPGYWDGHFVLTVEKTPLLFMGVEDEYGDAFDEYVGIGTSNPLNKLHVKMPSAPMGFDQAIRIETWGTDYNGYRGGGIITQHDGNITAGIYGLEEKQYSAQGALAFFTRIDTGDNEDFRDEFGVSLTEKMRITSDGNVGIGTTSPSAKLEVNGISTLTGKVGIATTNPQIHLAIGDNDTGLQQQGDGILTFYTNNQERLRINESGKVGIGTTSPSGRLELAGKLTATKDKDELIGLKIAPTFDDNSKKDVGHYGLIITEGNVGIGTAKPDAKLNIVGSETDAGGKTLVIGPTDKSNLRLGYHADYSWIQSHGGKPLVINPISSNVGIGTTSPGVKLEVSGDLKITGSFMPNYDSGWVKDDNKTSHQKLFPHGFKAIPSLLSIQFSPDKVDVYPLTWPWNGSEPGRSDKSGNPLSIIMNTENIILNISHGDDLHRYWDATKPSDMKTWAEGYWRVMAWK